MFASFCYDDIINLLNYSPCKKGWCETTGSNDNSASICRASTGTKHGTGYHTEATTVSAAESRPPQVLLRMKNLLWSHTEVTMEADYFFCILLTGK